MATLLASDIIEVPINILEKFNPVCSHINLTCDEIETFIGELAIAIYFGVMLHLSSITDLEKRNEVIDIYTNAFIRKKRSYLTSTYRKYTDEVNGLDGAVVYLEMRFEQYSKTWDEMFNTGEAKDFGHFSRAIIKNAFPFNIAAQIDLKLLFFITEVFTTWMEASKKFFSIHTIQ